MSADLISALDDEIAEVREKLRHLQSARAKISGDTPVTRRHSVAAVLAEVMRLGRPYHVRDLASSVSSYKGEQCNVSTLRTVLSRRPEFRSLGRGRYARTR